jgi:type IV secretory pathway TraG/TraD family ATPase VirD4
MQSIPQAGEVWMNIHTPKKATIQAVEEVAQARGKFVVIFDDVDGRGHRCDVQTFISNWKRNKTVSKWFLGALK